MGNGCPGFLVVGTVRAKEKPWRQKFTNLAEAEKVCEDWETERLRTGATTRVRATVLSQEVLRDAEAAWQLAKRLKVPSLLDAVLAYTGPEKAAQGSTALNPGAPRSQLPATTPGNTVSITFRQLFDQFELYHKAHTSKSHSDKVRQQATLFGDYIKWSTPITAITTKDIEKWVRLRTDGKARKTFNNVLNDISRVFSWACAPARKLLAENPALAIERFSGRMLAGGARQLLPVETCATLMTFLEEHHPDWCWPFAMMLFAGIRPGYHEGEMRKLVNYANRDGVEHYVNNGCIHISAEMAKDRRARRFTLPDNLLRWHEVYCPDKGCFQIGSKESYAEIRDKFHIPHDGLRHTAISAHVTKHGSFALAAEEFGNSERVIRTHYHRRMEPTEVEAFYAIVPRHTPRSTAQL